MRGLGRPEKSDFKAGARQVRSNFYGRRKACSCASTVCNPRNRYDVVSSHSSALLGMLPAYLFSWPKSCSTALLMVLLTERIFAIRLALQRLGP